MNLVASHAFVFQAPLPIPMGRGRGWGLATGIVLALLLLSTPAFAQSTVSPLSGGEGVGEKWEPVPNRMLDERWAPAYCLLADGKHALIAGGYSYAKKKCVDSADIYDERRHRFVHAHGHLHVGRDFADANLLPNGTVLVTGGYNTDLASLDTAELYVPRRNRFELLKSTMSNHRELFTATTLRNGRVLCAAGLDLYKRGTVNTADIFDPSTMTFHPVGTLAQDRFGAAACLLADGRVLIVGGKSWQIGHPDKPLASAEIFDPSTNTFHRTIGDMSVPRDRPTATLLPDGAVLIAGGQNGASGPLECEIFDPSTETFHITTNGLHTGRMAHCAAIVSANPPPVSGGVASPSEPGWVLFAGGWSPSLHSTTPTVELFCPSTGAFTDAPPLPVGVLDFALIEFPDGLILSAGGKHVDKVPSSVDTGSTIVFDSNRLQTRVHALNLRKRVHNL